MRPKIRIIKYNLLPERIIENKRQHACAVLIKISPNMTVSNLRKWDGIKYLNKAKLDMKQLHDNFHVPSHTDTPIRLSICEGWICKKSRRYLLWR